MPRQSTVYNTRDLQNLRERLDAKMKAHNLTPARLAAKAIVPLSTLTRILNGTVMNPGLDVLLSIAKALDVTLSELVGDAPTGYTTFTMEVTHKVGILKAIMHIIADEGISITNCFATLSNTDEDRGRIIVGIEPTPQAKIDHITKQITRLADVQNLEISENTKASQLADKVREEVIDHITKQITHLTDVQNPEISEDTKPPQLMDKVREVITNSDQTPQSFVTSDSDTLIQPPQSFVILDGDTLIQLVEDKKMAKDGSRSNGSSRSNGDHEPAHMA